MERKPLIEQLSEMILQGWLVVTLLQLQENLLGTATLHCGLSGGENFVLDRTLRIRNEMSKVTFLASALAASVTSFARFSVSAFSASN